MNTETTILLVGYGWFASIPEGETNNAELIARALDGEIIPGAHGRLARVHSLIVPVVWNEAFPRVEQAISALSPEIVLALGTDASACAMRPEPYAVNWMRGKDTSTNGRITDVDAPILPGGEMFLRGTLPFDQMTRAMLLSGVPAQTGALTDAQPTAPLLKKSTTGLYLCNYMAYRLAHLAKERAGLRTGFMHVPTRPEYVCARRLALGEEGMLSRPMQPSMPLEMMIRGTRAALKACY